MELACYPDTTAANKHATCGKGNALDGGTKANHQHASVTTMAAGVSFNPLL
jgi:hypothetical protein